MIIIIVLLVFVEPPLEILEEEPPVLLPEGHAVVEAAPVEGEAYGEDLGKNLFT